MIESLNDKIRSIIFEDNNILKSIDILKRFDPNKRKIIIQLFLSDFFKILFITDSEDIKIFKMSTNDLLYMCNTYSNFFAQILLGAKDFYKLSSIEKIIILEELEDEGLSDAMFNFNKLHILDALVYSFRYDLNCFKEYYQEYITKYDNSERSKNSFTSLLTIKMDDLKIINEDKYRNFALEFMRSFYKMHFYNISNNLNILSQEQTVYLEKIKNNTLGQLFNLVEKDKHFFNVIMKNYLNYTISLDEASRSKIDKFVIET